MGEFSRLEVICDDVRQELKNISLQYDILVNELDFDLLETTTFVSESVHSEFVELNPVLKENLKSKELALNPDLIIKQQYRIVVKKYKKDDKFHPIIKIGADKNLTKCIATISKDSIITPSPGLAREIKKEINKKKLRHDLLINIFDEKLHKSCERFEEIVRKFGGLKEDFQIVVCEGVSPKMPVLPQVVELYKKIAKQESRVDHRQRGIFNYVEKGSAVVEFVRGRSGEAGRNCRGEFVRVAEVDRNREPDFKPDDTMRVLDMGGSIIYYAEKSGFVDMSNGILSIKDSLSVDSVNLKQTGNIEATIDSKTTLNVVSSSFDDDSVAPYMVIKSKHVNVEGSVGAGASVEGEEVSVKGQTHQTSKISGGKVYIRRNKGQAFAKEMIIDILEGGVIEGENITIRNALSGDIKGKNVNIGVCGSNIKVFATHSININKIKGEGSIFIIDAEAYSDAYGNVEKIKNEINFYDKERGRLERKKASLMEFIKNNKESVALVREYVKESLKRSEEPNSLLLRKLEDYKKVVEDIKDFQSKMLEMDEKIKLSKLMLDNIQDRVFSSKIELKEGNIKDSLIGFRMLNPKINLSRAPKEGEHIFRLLKVDEEYIIKSE